MRLPQSPGDLWFLNFLFSFLTTLWESPPYCLASSTNAVSSSSLQGLVPRLTVAEASDNNKPKATKSNAFPIPNNLFLNILIDFFYKISARCQMKSKKNFKKSQNTKFTKNNKLTQINNILFHFSVFQAPQIPVPIAKKFP
jgi:hypothetical protein